MSVLLVFMVAALGTFALRVSMIVGGVGARVDDTWSARLGLVAPVMLSAIVASSLFLTDGRMTRPGSAEVVAVVVSALAVRRTGSLAVAFLVGFPVYWVLGAWI